MADIKAVFFDQDGVIIDTERDGHRVAFNTTFRDFGFDVEWDEDTYRDLLRVGGGKERMKYFLHTRGFGKEIKPEEEEELIQQLHNKKTETFIELIQSGSLPLRPGVKRLMHEILDEGFILGICTTSNEKAAHAIAYDILKDIRFDFVLAGDIVNKKKPDPEIYQLALQKTGLKPENCLVIEDSRNGLLAAKGAGMSVIVTTNGYTEQEDLSQADIIVTCLGEEDGEQGKLTYAAKEFDFEGVAHIKSFIQYFS